LPAESAVTCEVCGERGRTYDWQSDPPSNEKHWYVMTLCDRHAVEYYQDGRAAGQLFDEYRMREE
jgi:hypothetical protein